MTMAKSADTLQEAAQMISSMAQVDKYLNAQINDPQVCLQLIKRLAKRFNCSDEEAAKALQIPEARRRLELQIKLWSVLRAEDMQNLINEGADPDFSMRVMDEPL